MSSTFVADSTEKDDSLIIVLNQDGTITVDPETLNRLISHQHKNVNLVRVDGATVAAGDAQASEDDSHVNLTVEGYFPSETTPPPALPPLSMDGIEAGDGGDIVIDPFAQMEPEEIARLESALQSEQAKEILGTDLNLNDNLLDMLESTTDNLGPSAESVVASDHSYTSQSPMKAPQSSIHQHHGQTILIHPLPQPVAPQPAKPQEKTVRTRGGRIVQGSVVSRLGLLKNSANRQAQAQQRQAANQPKEEAVAVTATVTATSAATVAAASGTTRTPQAVTPPSQVVSTVVVPTTSIITGKGTPKKYIVHRGGRLVAEALRPLQAGETANIVTTVPGTKLVQRKIIVPKVQTVQSTLVTTDVTSKIVKSSLIINKEGGPRKVVVGKRGGRVTVRGGGTKRFTKVLPAKEKAVASSPSSTNPDVSLEHPDSQPEADENDVEANLLALLSETSAEEARKEAAKGTFPTVVLKKLSPKTLEVLTEGSPAQKKDKSGDKIKVEGSGSASEASTCEDLEGLKEALADLTKCKTTSRSPKSSKPKLTSPTHKVAHPKPHRTKSVDSNSSSHSGTSKSAPPTPVTETPPSTDEKKDKKKDKKIPTGPPAILGPELFSTPDIIRRVGGKDEKEPSGRGKGEELKEEASDNVAKRRTSTSKSLDAPSEPVFMPALPTVEVQPHLSTDPLEPPSFTIKSDDLDPESLLDSIHAEVVKGSEAGLIDEALLLDELTNDEDSLLNVDPKSIEKTLEQMESNVATHLFMPIQVVHAAPVTSTETVKETLKSPKGNNQAPAARRKSSADIAKTAGPAKRPSVTSETIVKEDNKKAKPKTSPKVAPKEKPKEVKKSGPVVEAVRQSTRRRVPTEKAAAAIALLTSRDSDFEEPEQEEASKPVVEEPVEEKVVLEEEPVFKDDENDEDYDDDDDASEGWNSEDDPDKLWCICRKPHNNRFMICCDTCEDWFHGKCVGISKALGQQMEAKGVEWSCPNCKAKKTGKELPKGQKTPKIMPGQKTSTKPSPKMVVAAAKPEQSTISSLECIVCKKPARASSNYCNNVCIRKHVLNVLMAIKKETDKLTSNSRVSVYERKSGRLITGEKAPTVEGIVDWLSEHQTYEIIRPNDIIEGKYSKHPAQKLTKQLSSEKQPTLKQSVLTTKVAGGSTKIGFASSKDAANASQHVVATPKGIAKSDSPFIEKDGKVRRVVKSYTIAALPSPVASTEEQKKKPQTPTTPTKQEAPKKEIVKKRKDSTETIKPKPKTSESSEPEPRSTSKLNIEPIRANVKRSLQELLHQRVKADPELTSVTTEQVKELSISIEEELFGIFNDCGAKYKSKYRSLLFNIKDPKNLTLYRKIVDRAISPGQLVRLSPEELASQELAQWREKEAKHQIEMIKKNELDLIHQAKTVVLKSRKGEEVIENKPHEAQISELESALNRTADDIDYEEAMKKEEKKEEGDELTKLEELKKLGELSHKDKDRKSDKKKSDKSRDRKRDRHHSSSKSSSHKRPRSSSRRHKSRSRSRDRDKKRSRDKPHRSRSKSRDEKKKEDVKKEEVSESFPATDLELTFDPSLSVPVETVPPEDIPLPDKEIKMEEDTELESKPSVKAGDIPLPVDLDQPKLSLKEDSDQSDREPTSTVISTPPYTGDTEKPPIWSGCLNMVEVTKLTAAAYEVSGISSDLSEELSKNLECVGRIQPDSVWEYVSRMKKLGTKDIVVIRFAPDSEEEKINYLSLYSYLSSRNRMAVIGNVSKRVKDFYVFPLASNSPIPRVLHPLDGPGFEDYRPHLLLGVIVRSRKGHASSNHDRKKVTVRVSHPVTTHHAKKKSKSPDNGSYTPPIQEETQESTSPSIAKSSVPGLTPPTLDEDDEPYSPGDHDPYSPSTAIGANLEDSTSNPCLQEAKPDIDIEKNLEEVRRMIEQKQKDLEAITSNVVGAKENEDDDDDNEAYSPGEAYGENENESKEAEEPKEVIPFLDSISSNIKIPSNLQEILACIRSPGPVGEPEPVGVPGPSSALDDPIVKAYTSAKLKDDSDSDESKQFAATKPGSPPSTSLNSAGVERSLSPTDSLGRPRDPRHGRPPIIPPVPGFSTTLPVAPAETKTKSKISQMSDEELIRMSTEMEAASGYSSQPAATPAVDESYSNFFNSLPPPPVYQPHPPVAAMGAPQPAIASYLPVPAASTSYPVIPERPPSPKYKERRDKRRDEDRDYDRDYDGRAKRSRHGPAWEDRGVPRGPPPPHMMGRFEGPPRNPIPVGLPRGPHPHMMMRGGFRGGFRGPRGRFERFRGRGGGPPPPYYPRDYDGRVPPPRGQDIQEEWEEEIRKFEQQKRSKEGAVRRKRRGSPRRSRSRSLSPLPRRRPRRSRTRSRSRSRSLSRSRSRSLSRSSRSRSRSRSLTRSRTPSRSLSRSP